MGIVLNFQDDPRLEETNILNPEWVTNGVYAILNSNELFQEKGVLKREMLNRILDSQDYPRGKHLFIVDMMRKFELCFDFEGFYDQKFLIPDLLSKEEPHTGEWDDALAFQYHYDVLPGNIISRFIVGMHPSIYKNTYWRSGVVLEDEDSGNKALVKADREDRKIFIWVNGREQNRRNFLGVIRSNLDYIHQTIPGITPEEKVPLPDHPEIVVDYRHLLDIEALGEESFIPEGLSERVHVKELLNGVEPEDERRVVVVGSDLNCFGAGENIAVVTQHQPTTVDKQVNMWTLGSSYLLIAVIIMTSIAVINKYVSWYVLPAVIIGELAIIAVIGALQLRLEGKLNQHDFLALMREVFKQLHSLKR